MRQRSPGGIDARAGKNSNILVFPLTHPIVLAVLLAAMLVFSFVGAVTGWIAMSRTASFESSSDRAQQAAIDAAKASERTYYAERGCALSEAHTRQMFAEINRLGIPMRTIQELPARVCKE